MRLLDDGVTVVATDPDRDALWIVDLETRRVRSIAFDAGAEPGRIAVDGRGLVHVALWGAGAVATIDPMAATLVWESGYVCSAPRGIAWDPAADLLHVACARGELVTLPGEGGPARRTVRLEPDLRDVVVDGDVLLVSRFRSAEVLIVAADGTITGRQMPATYTPGDVPDPVPTFVPQVAWRMIPMDDGGALVVHQRAAATSLTIIPGEPTPSPVTGYYYQSTVSCTFSVLHAALTRIRRDQPPLSSGVAGLVLPVDAVLRDDEEFFAIATPGLAGVGFASTRWLSTEGVPKSTPTNCSPGVRSGGASGQVVAVEYDPRWFLISFSREPARIDTASGVHIELPATSRRDPGHDLFHRATPTLIACASCHPGGEDDGHVWVFAESGARRSQTLVGGLLSSAPFHWSGDNADMAAIMDGGFRVRMNGGTVSEEQVRDISAWLDSLPSTPAADARADEAVLRGRAIFDAECAGCHSGARSSNNETMDIGTGEAVQVPTLVDVAMRAPYMHSGCAGNLREALGACGGAPHDVARRVGGPAVEDLIAYLGTL